MSKIFISIEADTASEARSLMSDLLNGTATAGATTTAPVAVEPVKTDEPKTRQTRAAKAEKAEVAVPATDPFAAAPATPVSTAQASTPEAGAAASASGPAVTSAASPSEVTYEELKGLMTQVLTKKSAMFARDTVEKATGHKALTGMPKELYAKCKAALEAALAS